jgi:hypothetical protein
MRVKIKVNGMDVFDASIKTISNKMNLAMLSDLQMQYSGETVEIRFSKQVKTKRKPSTK